MTVDISIDGVGELELVLDQLSRIWDDPDVAHDSALPLMNQQRENVRAKLNKNASGKLEGAIQVIWVDNQTVDVGVPKGWIRYALAHEYGVTIYPKKAKALRFEIDGEVIYAKKVRLPARPYIRPSVNQSKEKVAMAALKITTRKIMEIVNKNGTN